MNDAHAVQGIKHDAAVLRKMLYRNRNQHGSTQYYRRLQRVWRIYGSQLSAEAVPGLLETAAALLTKPPANKNSQRLQRAYEQDLSRAAARLRTVVDVCVQGMQHCLQASKPLAIQARLYTCTLHLAARVSEVHNAVLAALTKLPTAMRVNTAEHLQQLAVPHDVIAALERFRSVLQVANDCYVAVVQCSSACHYSCSDAISQRPELAGYECLDAKN
eukprot:19665-Heterococcus_DN1.PRE.2